MTKRFIVAFFTFIALIIPGALALALLVAPAQPAPFEPPGCDRNLDDALSNVNALQTRVKRLGVGGGDLGLGWESGGFEPAAQLRRA